MVAYTPRHCRHLTSPPSQPPTLPLPHRAPQAIQTASDYTWFLGSSALLLSLPMLIELQREATVMVLQRQREAEMSAMQEQARALNASTLENVVSSIKMLSGSGAPGAPPGSQGGGEDAKR